MRGATLVLGHPLGAKVISIHAPHAERDLLPLVLLVVNFISIHAPLAGCDVAMVIRPPSYRHFNPRAPCGARQRQHDALLRQPLISIHAPRAGRDWSSGDKGCRHGISIHAPRAGRDILIEVDGKTVVISIHAPHAGRDRWSRGYTSY